MDADAKNQAIAILKAYEDGKHRRYELLFAVNGGAFAVAALLHDKKLENPALGEIVIGLIIFTVMMEFDIFAFGYAMRKRAGDSALNGWEVFSWIGQAVLFVLCVLIIVGWLLVWNVFVGWGMIILGILLGIVVACLPRGLIWLLGLDHHEDDDDLCRPML
jgi:hypothetical protein